MVDLATLIAAGAPRPAVKLPIPEAQASMLLEAYARYAAPCPFKLGDLVTPRKGFSYTSTGEPHVVLEVAAEPHRTFDVTDRVTPSACLFGSRLDVRVACYTASGEIAPFWMESWCLEPYAGPRPAEAPEARADFQPEDYRLVADLIVAKLDDRDQFQAVVSNNFNIILAALRIAGGRP